MKEERKLVIDTELAAANAMIEILNGSDDGMNSYLEKDKNN